jgi:hypothetical protein
MMTNNPILDELHATRRKLLEESGGTLAGLVARLQAEQKASGRTILKTQRTIRCSGAAKSGDLPVESLSSPPAER